MSAFFKIGVKEDPNYNPYGTVFTERQQSIIRGETVNRLTTTEITKVIRKAEKMGNIKLAENVFCLYEGLLTGDNEFERLSDATKKQIIEDCKKRLQRLTPWKLEW